MLFITQIDGYQIESGFTEAVTKAHVEAKSVDGLKEGVFALPPSYHELRV